MGDCRSAHQLVLLPEELSQLEVESSLDALDGSFVLWPLATAFHVTDDWGQRESRRSVNPPRNKVLDRGVWNNRLQHKGRRRRGSAPACSTPTQQNQSQD